MRQAVRFEGLAGKTIGVEAIDDLAPHVTDRRAETVVIVSTSADTRVVAGWLRQVADHVEGTQIAPR